MKYTHRSLITSITIIFFIGENFLFPQETNYPKYPRDKPLPNIEKFPPAIQRLDSIKVKYFKDKINLELQGGKYEYSEKFLKDYARADISSRLFYSNIDGSGLEREYKLLTGPIGTETMKLLKQLPYPWGILIEKHGIVLAEVLNDTVLPKMYYPVPRPESASKVNNYVLKAKIIDDIFGTIEEDTVLIRHNHLITENILFNQYKDVKVIFSLKPGGTVQREGYVERIYLMGTPTEFMYVANGIIIDPNKVLNISGKKYQEFKQELLDFAEQEKICP
jgi:hypothetical protein